MHLPTVYAVLTLLTTSLTATSSPVPQPQKRAIDDKVFDDLVYYYKYASSTYEDCKKPNGNTMVEQFSDDHTDTQGFVARDDKKKEIIVAWRGSSSVKDFLMTDAAVLLKDWKSPGVNPPAGTKVHYGFQRSYDAVADKVVSLVKDQLSSHKGYSVVSTGHSLGGSLASLAAVSLKSNFPDTPMRLYTYGQPRTGNQQYADLVNKLFNEDNSFRFVRHLDGVPTAFPMSLGFRHHGVEYYQTGGDAISKNIKKCSPDGEDETCSNKDPWTGFNPRHLTQFDIKFNTPFCT